MHNTWQLLKNPIRITYKVLLLTYKTLHDLGPSYLEELLMPHNPTRQLRSSGKDLLKVAKSRLVHYGDKSFSVCAPSLWNDLPSSLRSSTSLDSFKNGLKTELFKRFINNSSLYMKKWFMYSHKYLTFASSYHYLFSVVTYSASEHVFLELAL